MWTCLVCGLQAKVPETTDKITCPCGFVQYCNPPGRGDRLAAKLARLGLTEHRYKKVKTALGLRGKCRCKQRQQWLNGRTS